MAQDIKTVRLNTNVNDVINELTAQYLENICKLFGHNVNISDTDWQTVYDFKLKAFEAVKELGLNIE